MTAPVTAKERITKNAVSITYIEQKLEKIETQLNQIQNDHHTFELTSIPLIQQNLQNIQTHLEQHQTQDRDAKLNKQDKTALYGSLFALIGLIAVEIIKNIF
jgi:hypothetical protein